MLRSTMSLLGLWQYDNTILNSMALPTGVERETLVNNMLMELAELEILYPDPDFFKLAVEAWSNKQLPIWTKLYETTQFTYDPIENYDRIEEWNENANTKQNTSGTSSSTDSSTSTGKVAGYNDEELVTRDSSDGTNTSNANSSVDVTNEHSNTRTGRAHGNIGVTTTQQMIKEERDCVQFNIYDYIIDDFKRRFCLLVY